MLEDLKARIEVALPDSAVEVSKPVAVDGYWFFDVRHNDQTYVIEGSAALSIYGLSRLTDDVGYGEKPDKLYGTEDQLIEGLIAWIKEEHVTD